MAKQPDAVIINWEQKTNSGQKKEPVRMRKVKTKVVTLVIGALKFVNPTSR